MRPLRCSRSGHSSVDPPFDDQDRGLRDTLLWLTVLELAADGRTVILASADKRAFGAGRLLPALVDEVTARCGDPSRVILAGSLSEANVLIEERTSTARRAAESLLGRVEIRADVIRGIISGAEDLVVSDRSLRAEGWPIELAGIRIDEIVKAGALSISSAALEDHTSLVVVELQLAVEAQLDARHEMEMEDDDCIILADDGEVWDTGIGFLDSLVQVHLTRDAIVLATAKLDLTRSSITTLEVVDARIPRRTSHDAQLRLAV